MKASLESDEYILSAIWNNGIKKDIIVNCKAAEIVAICELEDWCKEKGISIPIFSVEKE